jgi:cell division protein FtsW
MMPLGKIFKGIDKTLFFIMCTLLCVGLITLGSASSVLAEKEFGTPYYFVIRQIAFGIGMGGILFLLALMTPVAYYKKYAAPILLAAIILMVLVFPLGGAIKGAHRWIKIGGFSFQPSEFLKIAFVIYIAAWMSVRKKQIESFSLGLLPFIFIMGFVGSFLLLQRDLGTLGIVAITSLFTFSLGGARMRHVALLILMGVLLVTILIRFDEYRWDRVRIFLNPSADVQSAGYQFNQARIAIGSGGFFGRGLGLSRQKFLYLPEPEGDAIFAIFAEEFGFLGACVLIGLFLALTFRGMMISARTKDNFAALLASGITILVIVQVAINIGALTGLLPLTGIPLPFVSQGGTALAFLLFEMGMLLAISKKTT